MPGALRASCACRSTGRALTRSTALFAARAYYWVEQNYDEDKAIQFALGVFKAYWVTDHNIGDADFILNVAERYGLDSAAMFDGINNQEIMNQLHQMSDVAFPARHTGAASNGVCRRRDVRRCP